MMLAREDQSLLREILELGHELERLWTISQSQNLPSDLKTRLEKLKTLILKVKTSDTNDLARLAQWSEHLTPDMSPRHFTGILVPFERLSQRTLRDDEFLLAAQPDAKAKIVDALTLIPVLENIRSAFNVGAVFRTAECWGLEKIILSGYTPDPENEKTAKTAMGTDQDVLWERTKDLRESIEALKRDGYTVIALETVPSAEPLTSFSFPRKSALILGNERFGLDPDTISSADKILRIPLRGKKNSLNVGIAFGIAAYEFSKQWADK